MIKVTEVKPLDGTKLRLSFSDGSGGTYDCAAILTSTGPMVMPLKERTYFDRVFLDHGAPTWPNGFDMAPWALHRELSDGGKLRAGSVAAVE